MKRFFMFMFVAIAAIGIGIISIVIAASNDIKVIYNEEMLEFDQKPIIENGKVLVPIRPILEKMKLIVSWDSASNTVTAVKDNMEVRLTIGEKLAYINNEPILLDVPARLENERTLVPLRFLLEGFRKKVDWDESKNTVIIMDGDNRLEEELPIVGSYENFIKLLEQSETGIGKYDQGIRLNNKEILFTDTAQATNELSKASKSDEAYSKTNVQVQGVDEADTVKTDGEYIYYIKNQNVNIFKAIPADGMKLINTLTFENDFNPIEIYVDSNHLTVIGRKYFRIPDIYYRDSVIANDILSKRIYRSSNMLKMIVYDIRNRQDIKDIREIEIDGDYVSSRKVGSKVYLVANKYFDNYYIYSIYKDKGERREDIAVPYYKDNLVTDDYIYTDFRNIRYFRDCISDNYLIVAGVDLDKQEKMNISTFLGAGNAVYCSEENLYVATSGYKNYVVDGKYNYDEYTQIIKFKLDESKLNYQAKGEVPGKILNQFSMDENGEYFRIATTKGRVFDNTSGNNLYVLDKNLKTIGKIEDIAKGEEIYSVRFMGDRAYMVTFRTVDPLFVIDLKDATNPKILGALKIPGYSDYIHPYDDNHIIGFGKDTVDIGDNAYYQGFKMAIFDVTDVANPKEQFKEIIGDRGTTSELLNNHKALLFSKEKNLLAFPITLMEVKNKAGDLKQDALQYGEFTFQGLYVYKIDLKDGFKLKGRITHITDEEYMKAGRYYSNSDSTVQRGLYIGDVLYTLSNKLLKANDINTIKEIGVVEQ